MQGSDLKKEERAVRPTVLMDGFRMLRDVHGMFQNEGEDRLRDGIGAVGGHVGDDDAAFGSFSSIDDIVARCRDADLF